MRGHRWALLCLLAACGGGGSGGDGKQGVCDRYASIDVAAMIGKCNLNPPSDLPTKAVCESAIPSCDADDMREIGSLLDCVSSIGNCKVGQEDAWAGQWNGCFERTVLSSACGNALFQ